MATASLSSVYNSSEEDFMPDDEIFPSCRSNTLNLHEDEENQCSSSVAVAKSRHGHRQQSASQRKVNATFLKSNQLDSLVNKTRTKLEHLCEATNRCRLVNDVLFACRVP